MHASFRIGDTVLMASDGRCQGKPTFEGFSLSLTVPDENEAERRLGKCDLGKPAGGCSIGDDAWRTGRKHRLLLERTQIDIAPSFAAPAGKAKLGKAGEAALAIASQPVWLTLALLAPERFEVRSHLGLDRKIQNGTHRH